MKPIKYSRLKLSETIQKKLESILETPWDSFITVVGLSEKTLIKKRLMMEQQGRCNKCNNYEWLGVEIPLEIEHISGDDSDNSRSNVELLCPNCHALTVTWRGRNKKKLSDHKVSDEELLAALISSSSIRQALISVGMAGKGKNYNRAYELLSKHKQHLLVV